jgi:hypothetical protein
VSSGRKQCDCGHRDREEKHARAGHSGKEEDNRFQYAIGKMRENLPGLTNEYLSYIWGSKGENLDILKRSGIKPDY